MTAQIIPHDFHHGPACAAAAELSNDRYVVNCETATNAARITAANRLLVSSNWRDRHTANKVLNMIGPKNSGGWMYPSKPKPRRNYAGTAFAALVVAGVLIFATLAGAEALHRADAMIAAPMLEGFK